MKIDFTENKYGNFALSGIYLLKSIKHLGLGLWGVTIKFYEKVMKRYPLACVLLAIGITFIVTLFSFGDAVKQRNELSKELYQANLKLEQHGLK